MPKKMCEVCPFRPDSELHQKFDEIMPIIDEMTRTGELVGPHTCHSVQPDNFFPANKEEECAGHRQYLKDHYGTVGKSSS